MQLSGLPARGRRALSRLSRRLRRVEGRVVSLPPGAPLVGQALLSYIIDPFLLPAGAELSYAHTQDWESFAIAGALRDLGFSVDAIHWTNRSFIPAKRYDIVIDVRALLERLDATVSAGAVRIFHAETAHWKVSDEAQLARLAALEARRGIRLSRTRLVGANRGIECADCAVVLGNEWTLASYRPFGKPLYRVPISNAFTYSSPAGRDFQASRRRFLWFGGVGFVHKGLDRVLEAFAGMPELELAVAAPLDREPDFARAFARELRGCPNIRALGWLDVGAGSFLREAARTSAMIFPSCSEGGGGSAITAMHAGLIPVLSSETSVDVDPSFGVLLRDSEVETVRAAAREIAARDPRELEAMAVNAWRRANEEHTRERFAERYRDTLIEILERFRPDLARGARG